MFSRNILFLSPFWETFDGRKGSNEIAGEIPKE